MDSGADDRGALRGRLQRRGDELAGGREDDRGVERLGAGLHRVARPLGAEAQRELARGLVTGAREGEHTPALCHGDLADDVGGGAEDVKGEPARVAGHAQGAGADQPGAQQRCGLEVGVAGRDIEAVALVGDGELGVAPVDVAAGEPRAVAQVLAAAPAVLALAVGPAEPRHADPPVGPGDRADDLVPDHERRARHVELAVDDVQVGAADAARVHLDQQLAGPGLGVGHGVEPQRLTGAVEEHGAHRQRFTPRRPAGHHDEEADDAGEPRMIVHAEAASLRAVISTNQFKNGTHVEVDGKVFKIVEFQHVKPGKGGAFVRTKLKRVDDGAVIDKTFRAGEKFRPVRTETRKMQFLYADGTDAHFMDTETFDQLPIPEEAVAESLKWVMPNEEIDLLYVDERPTEVQVPSAVELTVSETEPGVRGDTASGGGDKPATLESGVTVRVPLFVNVGDRVRVDTRSGEYVSRA